MSVFGKILEKLGLKKDQDEAPAAAPTATAAPAKPTAAAPAAKPAAPAAPPKPTAPSTPAAQPGMVGPSGPATPPKPVAISEVDVVKQLEAKAKGTGLNWKQSIADLLSLLEIDNSREARKELAEELGAPADVMSDSARMNTWLHKTVLKKIAENGGNIPKELLD
ncbi:MAG TPA: DUF3597 domain-containing protein [Anaerolineales bacterium]|nr:DUF3597 domain-containing protein [Anaerolineales bacterium]